MPRRVVVGTRYRGDVIAMTGRLLLSHWPALIAWFLGGVLARYLVIELAGYVGASSALGGLLLMPLAILARLVAFVAMFLVLRDGMFRLGMIAPLPHGAAERRRAFIDAVLGGILPFFAFYAAWGYLRDDMAAYSARALEVQSGLDLAAIAAGEEALSFEGTIDRLEFEPVTIALIVVAFAGRWAWKRYRERLPRALSIGAVYLEAVWVFLTVMLISQLFGSVSAWVQSRQAMVWLADARTWIGAHLEPIAWTWEAVEWFLGEAGGIMLLPIAWLAIAGVIYGQAVAPEAPRVRGQLVDRVHMRYSSLPQAMRRRLGDFWAELVSRFRPIGEAIVLMWRAGPVLIGGYILLYTVVLGLEQLLRLALTRIIGPHDLYSFWLVADTVVLLLVPLVIEPLRVSLVASAYDATLSRLVSTALPAADSGTDGQAKEFGKPPVDDDVEGERADGVVRDDEGHHDRERLGPAAGA
ncbi:hypothetical protein [Agromyces ramosus]|uniref:ABC transmembrane type-1 domain-containing protein n=1 Tax=Agromyces ramosus TaxID=33879 RepID=A0ABU0R995_9MICO|nr:hypothetical protein [Agromyces ramosus]MDQ0894307.1 hypothetical protein [Agromyces ramosus]